MQTQHGSGEYQEKGFRIDEDEHHEDSHKHYRFYVDGEPSDIETHFSTGNRDITDYEIRRMKHQVKLKTQDELLALFKCTMSHDEYRALLLDRGHI
jgi:hypothetical protein